MFEESLIGVVFGVSLIVELNIVEVNKMTDIIVDVGVASQLVMTSFKIGGLWSMADDLFI